MFPELFGDFVGVDGVGDVGVCVGVVDGCVECFCETGG